jgi:hypothetical protein
MHFNIPKLEGLQRVTWKMGAPYQYTSDITERRHIKHVKTPYRRSSHRNFHEQCCRYMVRVEKMHFFGLYVSLKSSLLNEMFKEASKFASHYPEATWLSRVCSPGDISIAGGASKQTLFDKVRSHISDDKSIAFLVNVTAHHTLTVDNAALLFKLSDFHATLGKNMLSAGRSVRRTVNHEPRTCEPAAVSTGQ